MDKLTLIALAANQPMRAVVFDGNGRRVVECADCCLQYLEFEEAKGNGHHVEYVLGLTELADPIYQTKHGHRACHGKPLEFE